MDAAIAVAAFLLTLLLVSLIFYAVRRALTRAPGASELASLQGQGKRDAGLLWGLILVALVYGGLLRFLPALTGIPLLDGSIGLALGLYICSHPAANAVNMLFFERDTLRNTSEWSVLRWLALNLLALLAGWSVIFVALRRVVGTAV